MEKQENKIGSRGLRECRADQDIFWGEVDVRSQLPWSIKKGNLATHKEELGELNNCLDHHV